MNRKIFISGTAALIYWIAFWIDFFLDLHLDHYGFGFALKALFPVAVLTNLAGAIFAISIYRRKATKPSLAISGLALNLIPILAVLSVFLWFIFFFAI